MLGPFFYGENPFAHPPLDEISLFSQNGRCLVIVLTGDTALLSLDGRRLPEFRRSTGNTFATMGGHKMDIVQSHGVIESARLYNMEPQETFQRQEAVL